MLPNVVKSLSIYLILITSVHASPFEPQKVYTSDWEPYVNEEQEKKGSISRLIELVFLEMGLKPERETLDYYFSYKLVKEGKALLSYPYFKTDQRLGEVVFSEPLIAIENGLFFNNRWQKAEGIASAINQKTIGKVAGYSYGQQIEPLLSDAKVYNSELQALVALSEGEIDLLPVSVKVAQKLLRKHFPHRLHEFKLLDDFRSQDNLYLVANQSEEGRQFIHQFNTALLRLQNLGMIEQMLSTQTSAKGSGYVRLVAAEGFPLITGYTLDENKKRQYYVIPHGSRATVLAWSDVVLKAHPNEKVYEGMMKHSLVDIVDGPHSGRSLYVRNMHLEVE